MGAGAGRKIDSVLVYRFDRFARSTKQLVDTLEEMNHLGVDFVSFHEQIDTSSPMGKAMFTIGSAISEFRTGNSQGTCSCGAGEGDVGFSEGAMTGSFHVPCTVCINARIYPSENAIPRCL